ncbi:MAG: 30S ribosomal protein S12 methylthiotransferase RimO [Nitrospirota bacterium]
MAKMHITTLGCPKNQVDSDHLAGRFLSEGFVPVRDAGDADIILVNTCGFIRDAKEESIGEILRLAALKEGREKKLLVFGCLAKRYKDELLKEIPEIDALWGVAEEDKIIEYCRKLAKRRRSELEKLKEERPFTHSPIHQLPDPPDRLPSSYAYLKIAEGCDKKCTFCVIPSLRGRFRSVPPATILKEAEEHILSGVRELILVAQDITNYGKDLDSYNLVSLLRDLTALKGDFFIRLLYLYPTAITDELIECIATEDKIQKYIDIPLQHSEDRILWLMGRRGTRKEYTKLIRTIRRRIPEMALRTTFIVGFPSETEEDFHGLVDFIEEMRFDRLGVFAFSKEEGTPSAQLKGQVPEKVKQRRLDDIMQRQALISLEKNRELIGKKFTAIIDEIDDEVALARLYSHAPEIDGMVIIEKSEARKQKPENRNQKSDKEENLSSVKVGDVVTVEIIDAYDYDVKGRIVDEGSSQSKHFNKKLRVVNRK